MKYFRYSKVFFFRILQISG